MYLDIEKAYNVYNAITEDKFRYNQEISEYNKIVCIMERIIDSVNVLNKIRIDGPNYNFVLWINYADLLSASINELAKIYNYTIDETNIFFVKYHNNSDKTDYDYFRFIRAIILSHALKLDAAHQKEFTKNKTAYCPSLSVGTENEILIKYLIDDLENQVNYIRLTLSDFEDYICNFYNNLESFIPVIEERKKNKRSAVIYDITNEEYLPDWSLQQKVAKLKEYTKKYGTIEDKQEKSSLMSAINTALEISTFNFSTDNIEIINKYKSFLNKALDNYFEFLKNRCDNYDMLYEITIPYYSYSIKYKEFNTPDCGYVISKISCGYKHFDTHIEKIYLNGYKSVLEPHLKKYIKLNNDITMKEYCLLVIIAFSVYKIEQEELKPLFS